MPGAYGLSPVSLGEVKEALRLPLNWYCAGPEATQLSPLLQACMAVATGQARHVACFRTVVEATAMAAGTRSSNVARGGDRVADRWQWQAPFNATSATIWIAMIAQRYFHEFGATREQLGAIALNARRNAALNPKAVFTAPLTMDEYLASRTISTPLCLLDCDVPVDGATVVIVSHVDGARDLKQPPVRVESICGPLHGRDTWDQMDDLTRFAGRRRRAAGCGRAPRSSPRTSTSRSSTTVSRSSRCCGSRAWASASAARRRASSRAARASRSTASCRCTPAAASCRPAVCTASATCTRPCCNCAARRATRQVPNTPEVAVVSNGGGPIAGAALLTRM